MAPCNLLLCLVEIVAERAVRNENATNIASNANTDNEETNDNEANNDLGNRNSEGKIRYTHTYGIFLEIVMWIVKIDKLTAHESNFLGIEFAQSTSFLYFIYYWNFVIFFFWILLKYYIYDSIALFDWALMVEEWTVNERDSNLKDFWYLGIVGSRNKIFVYTEIFY